jgi:glycosyltransferase involved in cell wall biosynthesis
MIFAQNIPYVRQHTAFTMADHEGSAVAHHDLVEAILKHSATIDGIHIFIDSYSDASRRVTEMALAELRGSNTRTEIAVRSVREMDKLTREQPHMFFTAENGFLPLSQCRLAFGRHAYPICSLIHAIDGPTMLSIYTAAVTCGLPYDTLIATSRAGAETVQGLLDGACQFLQASLGSQVRARLRVVRIPLGVDTEFIQVREKGLCRSILGLPQDRTILLYVGRLSEEQKGDMDPLLLAFRHILEENRHVHLMIAGQDSGKAYATIVDRTAKAMGLEGHVSFMLNFPHFSKPLLYSAADIFVSPADNIQETFGLVLVEALAAGLPIVASDWSGYRDIVSRENGFTVPTLWDSSASAMISSIAPLSGFNATRHFLAQRTILDTGELYRSLKTLVDNPDLRKKLGAASRERALQEFAWPKIIEQYDQLWREQQERLELEKAGEALPGFCLDYEKLFRHFATEVLNPGIVLQVNPCNAQVVMRPDILRAKLPLSLHPDHVSLVMDQLENGKSLTVGDLMSAPRGCSMAAIAWLMKKGALEIKRTPDIVES